MSLKGKHTKTFYVESMHCNACEMLIKQDISSLGGISDVGIAMGTGTDVAIESADIVLVGGSIHKVIDAIEISKTTVRVIKQNLFWSFGYNVLGIPIAAGILYPTFGILIQY